MCASAIVSSPFGTARAVWRTLTMRLRARQVSVSSHLKSNPRRYRRVICKSNPQRRVGYGEEKQMGILQSHLSTVPQSQYGREDTDPRGVLRSLWLQPKVCNYQAQRSFSRAEYSSQTTPAFFQVHFSGPFDPASHLGGIGLPLVSAAKSAPAALAALGQKTLFPLPTHRTATAPKSLRARSIADSKPKKPSSSGASTDAPSPAHCSNT